MEVPTDILSHCSSFVMHATGSSPKCHPEETKVHKGQAELVISYGCYSSAQFVLPDLTLLHVWADVNTFKIHRTSRQHSYHERRLEDK